MRQPTRTRRQGAFSLIESVVVAGVISLIVIFLIGLIPSLKLANKRAGIELTAGNLAQSRLENLRLTAFEEISAVTFPNLEIDGVTFQSHVIESDVVTKGTPPEEIGKRVRVEVTWTWNGNLHKTFRESKFCKVLRS